MCGICSNDRHLDGIACLDGNVVVKVMRSVWKPFIPSCLNPSHENSYDHKAPTKLTAIEALAIYVVHVDASLKDNTCAGVAINTDPNGRGAVGGTRSGDGQSGGNGLERSL